MRCPVCRADVEQGPQCRRCRADLSLLFALQEQRRHAFSVANQYLREGRWRAAQAVAEGIDTLRHDADSCRLLAVVALFQRNFDRARDSYRAAQDLPAPPAMLESK
jgi:Tfp pilus assembly protein PilF